MKIENEHDLGWKTSILHSKHMNYVGKKQNKWNVELDSCWSHQNSKVKKTQSKKGWHAGNQTNDFALTLPVVAASIGSIPTSTCKA